MLISLIACFTFVATGQKSVKESETLTKNALCQISELTFQCPQGFSSFFKNEDKGLLIFRDSKEKNFGLFISVQKQAFDEKELFNDLTKSVVAKLFPSQPQDYEWTKSEVILFDDGEKPMSKYQISSKTTKGYNKKHLVFGNLRNIKFNDKHFIVGYFIEMEKGKDARKQFQNNFVYAGEIPCNAQLKLIYSIVGEETRYENPCEVIVTV